MIAAPLFAVYQYVQSLVALEWRLWLTRLLLRKYFANHAYFALKAEGTTDNPDQRICDDVRNFVDSCTSVLLAVAQKTLSMGAFFGVLWGISPNLVAFCFLYSLFGTVVTTRVFGAKLMGLHFLALRREADLRFQLVRAREHAESVALYRGAARELAAARAKLAAAARTLLRKIEWGRTLALFTNAYEFATFALPSLIIAPRFFAGEVEFGVVTQAGYAFRTVQGALNIVVGRFEQLGARRGDGAPGTTLGDARHHRRCRERERSASAATSGKGNRAEEIALRLATGTNTIPRVSYDAACLATARRPPGTRLRAHAHLSPRAVARPHPRTARGRRRAVVGPSGCGKSSLLRAVAGVWSEGTGEIIAPARDDALFLPQAPYMPLGSLRAQVLFPDAAGESEDDADPSSATASRRRRPRLDDVSTTTISSPRSTRAASATSWDVSPTAGVWTRARSGRTSSPPGNNNGWRSLVCTCVARVARFSTRRRRRWTKHRRRRCTRWRGGARGRSSAWDTAGRCSGTTRGCCDSSRRLGAARGRGWRNPSRVADPRSGGRV